MHPMTSVLAQLHRLFFTQREVTDPRPANHALSRHLRSDLHSDWIVSVHREEEGFILKGADGFEFVGALVRWPALGTTRQIVLQVAFLNCQESDDGLILYLECQEEEETKN